VLSSRGVAFRQLAESSAGRDEHELAAMPAGSSDVVEGSVGLDASPDDTPFLRLVTRAQRELRLLQTSRREPWLLWLRSAGVPEPWLPPRAFASRFLDIADEDETGEASEEAGDDDDEQQDGEQVERGHGDLDEDDFQDQEATTLDMTPAEFDRLLRTAAGAPSAAETGSTSTDIEGTLRRRVFGGYVALLDEGVGRLMEALESTAGTTPTLVIVTGGLGARLRAPQLLSGDWRALGEEMVHTPLVVRVPGRRFGLRRQALVQPLDVYATLADWFDVDVSGLGLEGASLLPVIRGATPQLRERAWCGAGRLQSVRTSEHYLVTQAGPVTHGGGDESTCRLFAKPDDIWEINDLAGQQPVAVEQLSQELRQFFSEQQAT
jgi:arylsulfatase A-like enzyme